MLSLIGIGSGNPQQITLEAIEALNQTDVFFLLDKGPLKEDLLHVRQEILERYIQAPGYRLVQVEDPRRGDGAGGYVDNVEDWHRIRARLFARLIEHELGDGQTGAFLIWGDPSLYDSTLRILERVEALGLDFEYRVIPGISSVQALTARHRIPLNRIGEPIRIMPGRCLAGEAQASIDNLVVMLDAHCGFAALTDEDLEIYWGAYLGTADEILIAGRLQAVKAQILEVREAARLRKGWIMDTYLLRRPLASR